MSDDPAADPAAADPAPNSEFDRVPPQLRAALERRGFTALTPVQTAALGAIEEGRDLRISSQTGSGKTVALGMALAPELIDLAQGPPPRGPQALVIAPTRELASQVCTELEWLFADIGAISIDCFTGGTHVGHERKRLQRRPRVVVGTPGRLLDHIRSEALDCTSVTQLVLDEADQMLDMGFRDELEAILEAIPDDRRTHLVSATFPPGVKALVARYQNDPLAIEGTRLGEANTDIQHVAHVVDARDRYGAIVNLLLLAQQRRTLLFVATRAQAAELADELTRDGFAAASLSGDLAQRQRTRTLDAFKSGSVHTLVATDVAARGLDVPDVPVVIHGDLPLDSEVYTHRSGRTGRAGNKGRSVTLVSPRSERRARRMFDDARVEVQWSAPPSAEDVRRALDKRARKALQQALDSEELQSTEEQRELARSLLEGRDAVEVVAALLSFDRPRAEREPFEIGAPRTLAVTTGPRTMRSPTGGARHRDAPGDFTRYRINWGFRSGANPRRVLAVVCRRGEISSASVGAIRIDAFSTSFDVATSEAPAFEANAYRRDDRHPSQRIERDRGAPPERERRTRSDRGPRNRPKSRERANG